MRTVITQRILRSEKIDQVTRVYVDEKVELHLQYTPLAQFYMMVDFGGGMSTKYTRHHTTY
jgi:hypothetical protein